MYLKKIRFYPFNTLNNNYYSLNEYEKHKKNSPLYESIFLYLI